MLWRLRIRRRRYVRFHLANLGESIEGILLGVSAGHYVLRTAALVKGQGQTEPLAGELIRIPVRNVLFEQELRP